MANVVFDLLRRTRHDAKAGYTVVMPRVAISLVALTLIVLTIQVWRPRGSGTD